MIIDEVVFHNFGPYRGQQRVVLTPPTKGKPITLVGALNGCGKTSLSEGLQLALFGRQSPPARDAKEGYDAYLRDLIHRSVKPSDGAAVVVTFRVFEDGEEHRYTVDRSWAVNQDKLIERLGVFVDDVPDRALADTWSEQVERILPARLAHLFFFDGERIAEMAEPAAAAEALSVGIHALLGLDLVNQLSTDIQVLVRRKQKETLTEGDSAKVEEAEKALHESNGRLTLLRQERAALQNELDQAQRTLDLLDARFAREGGELYSKRKELEVLRQELQSRFDSAKSQLVELASGALPLAVAKAMLPGVIKQAKTESEVERNTLLSEVLEERDSRLVEKLRKAGMTKFALGKTLELLRADRRKYGVAAKAPSYLQLPYGAHLRLDDLLRRLLPQELKAARSNLRSFDEIQSEIDDVDRRLASVPDADAIGQLVRDRETAKNNLIAVTQKGRELDEILQQAEIDRTKLANQLDDLMRTLKGVELHLKDASRFIRHAEKLAGTMDRFKVALISRHVSRLESLIMESFLSLLRKQSLVTSLHIDPLDCRMELRNSQGQDIPPKRLSAGERQLLAISILWGLARASGRSLPIVIDTPLGRLDSSHRGHVVERYFPNASHQVLLLSTDEEIVNGYHATLSPWIGHTYLIEHDDTLAHSRLTSGYFAGATAHVS